MCISWMRSAKPWYGTLITISPISAILPPPLPVSAMVFIPFFLAVIIASLTFLELPLELMANSTSPFYPMPLNT